MCNTDNAAFAIIKGRQPDNLALLGEQEILELERKNRIKSDESNAA
jgi:hypothetical protein